MVSASGSHADLRAYAREQAANAGIPADWFVNQIEVESHFNPDARGGSGEVGVAQMLPSTAAGLGVNPYDPRAALRGAAQMMARYYHQYGDDYAKALAGYNCGGGCLQHAVVAGGISWGCYVPGSTRSYIWEIMSERVCS
jgi:soluble lytic murein transglycosylase-like protein